MMERRLKRRLAAAAAALFLLPCSGLADCTTGKHLYETAVSLADIDQRITLLAQSAAECPDFNVSYELGKAREADGRLAQAVPAYRDARNLAGSEKARARALARLGGVYEKMGRAGDAYACFRQSIRRHSFPSVAARLKEMDRARAAAGMSSQEIKSALTAARSNFHAQASLDLYIHFEFDSDRLDASGKAQAEALGRALSDPVFAGAAIILVGHTDAMGSQAYNQPLSERRAAAVKSYLVERFPLPPQRIQAVGRGETDLLYSDAADQALNRRVEIRIE